MKWESRQEAANILFENNFYSESIIMYWQCLRNMMFSYLLKKEIEYVSTSDALKHIVMILDRSNPNLANKISFFEVIATLAEWDGDKVLTIEQAQELKELYLELKIELCRK